MNDSMIFYLCPACFYASATQDGEHEHPLLRVDPGQPGEERRKPLIDKEGRILDPAPRWFHEAVLRARMNPETG